MERLVTPRTRAALELALFASVACVAGCAHEALPPEPPLSPYAAYPPPAWNIAATDGAYAWSAPPGSPWAGEGPPQQPGTSAFAEPRAQDSGALPPPFHDAYRSSTSIPNGEACLDTLRELGVTFRSLEDTRGVQTPIEVAGTIGGVRYHAGAGLPFVCDCRLAVALAWTAPTFRELGISDVRYSGVYVYRMSRVGRLSLHAYGHAIDLHAFTAQGNALEVKQAYQVGMSEPCAPSAPLLNQLACRLKASGLFKEMLTPDYNADHHDHFHLGLAPLEPGAPSRVARHG